MRLIQNADIESLIVQLTQIFQAFSILNDDYLFVFTENTWKNKKIFKK